MYRVICLVVLCGAALNSAFQYSDCGSEVGRFTKVTVSGCDVTKPSCILRRNTNATIEITFTTTEDVSSVETVVHGVIAGVHVPFPVPNPLPCNYPESGITCPLAKGGIFNYKATLPVSSEYPRLSVTVEWALENQNHDNIACVSIPARIR